MKMTRYSEPQILAILRQAEGGVPVAEICREHGMMPLPGNGLPANHERVGFDAASAVVTAPSIARQAHPQDAAERGRQSARPKRVDARKASLRAIAPVVSGFHGLAFLRGGMTAAAPRSAMASWHFLVS